MRLRCLLITAIGVVLLAMPSLEARAGQSHVMSPFTVTFRLILYGNAPEGERFTMYVIQPGARGGSPFCGDEFVQSACEGGGRVYTTIAGGSSEVPFFYTVTRVSADDAPGVGEEFVRFERSFTANTTVSLYYVYDEEGKPLGGGLGDGPGDGDKQDGQQTPEPTAAPTPAPGIASTATPDGIPGAAPDVGGGGDAGRSHMPAYTALALLALLAGSGYTAGRRRWTQRFSASRPRQE